PPARCGSAPTTAASPASPGRRSPASPCTANPNTRHAPAPASAAAPCPRLYPGAPSFLSRCGPLWGPERAQNEEGSVEQAGGRVDHDATSFVEHDEAQGHQATRVEHEQVTRRIRLDGCHRAPLGAVRFDDVRADEVV